MSNTLSLSEQIADRQHLVRVNNQLLKAIEIALEERTGRDRHRLDRQRGLLERERALAAQELRELRQFEYDGGWNDQMSPSPPSQTMAR